MNSARLSSAVTISADKKGSADAAQLAVQNHSNHDKCNMLHWTQCCV
jgi:hypothetical protein